MVLLLNKEQVEKVYHNVNSLFYKAKKYMNENIKLASINESVALTDAVPGWNEHQLRFGDYKKSKYSVLFVDMRNSTTRAISIGPRDMFLTMYAYLPTMMEAVHLCSGSVIDIMGDGIMAMWESNETNSSVIVKNAGICGGNMLQLCDKVTNEILRKNRIEPIEIGVGVSYGLVIVTKIGFQDKTYDVKAFGHCINEACYLSNGKNEVKVSKNVRNIWPISFYGEIQFNQSESGYVLKR